MLCGCFFVLTGFVGTVLGGCRSEVGKAEDPATVEPPEQVARVSGYDLSHPDRSFQLPSVLAEVSGLTDISETSVGCVQDEEGVIFVYDLEKRAITSHIPFGDPGDYEGLSFVNGTFFALRSDGVLFTVAGDWECPQVSSHTLEARTKNHEGLGFDARHRRLLIAAKSPAGKGKDNKDRRLVFGFDVVSMRFETEPVLEIRVRALHDFAMARGIRLSQKTNKKGRTRDFLRLLPASIAVHPSTDEIYVLSAMDRTLAVFDRAGKVQALTVLPEDLFAQPEGITFLPSGDMIISNEAAGGTPNLLVFRWIPAPAPPPTVPSAHDTPTGTRSPHVQ